MSGGNLKYNPAALPEGRAYLYVSDGDAWVYRSLIWINDIHRRAKYIESTGWRVLVCRKKIGGASVKRSGQLYITPERTNCAPRKMGKKTPEYLHVSRQSYYGP